MKFKLLFGFLLGFFVASAQETNYLFHVLDDNLVGGINKQVYSTSDGFIWIACDDGLLRFDGRETEIYPLTYCKSFFKSQAGKDYIVHDGGIELIKSSNTSFELENWYKANSFKTDTALYQPKTVFEDSKSNIWVSEGTSIVRINPLGEFKRFEFQDNRQSPHYVRSFSLGEDQWGTIWTVSYTGNIYYFENGSFKKANHQFEDASFMLKVGKSNFWIGYRDGIVEISLGMDKQVNLEKEICILEGVSAVTISENQEIMIGTWGNGLYQLDNTLENPYPEKVTYVPFKDINNIHFDRYGDLWVNSNESVGVLHKSVFDKFPLRGELNITESVTAIDGNYMTITEGYNMFHLINKDGNWSIENYFQPTNYMFNALTVDNKLFALDFESQISVWDLKDGSAFTVPGIKKYVIYNQFAMVKDKQKNVWVSGNPNQGVYRIDQNFKVHSYNNTSLKRSRSIREDLNGNIYCVTDDPLNYLYRYDFSKDEFENVSVPLTFPPDENFLVDDVAFSYYYAWLATSQGLLRLDIKPDAERNIEQVDFGIVPSGTAVKAVAVSIDGSIWAAGTFGLIRYHEGSTQLFDRTLGLPSKVIKPRGLAFDAKNNLWLTTENGVATIRHNSKVRSVTNTPIIKNLIVNGKQIEEREELEFRNNSALEISYMSLEYPAKLVKYQTRIQGINEEWSTPSDRDLISILNSSPGKYTFQVRAQKKGAGWSEPNSVPFTILKAWYQQWYTYLGLAALLLVIFLAANRWHTKSLKQRNKNLEEIITERTKEILEQRDELSEQKDKITAQLEMLQEKNKQLEETKTALVEANDKFVMLRESKLKHEIESKNKQLTTHTLHLIQKNEALKGVSDAIGALISTADDLQSNEFRKLQRLIDESYLHDKDWDDFKLYFEEIYTGFNAKLTINYPELTSQDLKLCALIRLNMSINECATILGISPESVKTSKFRLRKKLNLTSQKGLVDFLMAV